MLQFSHWSWKLKSEYVIAQAFEGWIGTTHNLISSIPLTGKK